MAAWTRRVAVGLAVGLLAVACAKVPFTGRKQFNVIPAGVMHGIGKQSYAETLAAEPVVSGTEDVKLLRQVGRRIAKQADEPSFDWSYNLIDAPVVNAWCMPGGYIAFYTGILPVLQSEAGMAFVMGHEVGHAIAKHGAERLSQQAGLLGGLGVLDVLLSGSGKLTDEQRGLVMAAAGMGAQLGVQLPFSRAHEKEADVIGLMYMSGAGYPPKEALAVWDRMEALAGPSGPRFLSTHPSNEARQDNLREWMPAARKRYQRNPLPDEVTRVRW
jgi:predicted Zn-dependent protease